MRGGSVKQPQPSRRAPGFEMTSPACRRAGTRSAPRMVVLDGDAKYNRFGAVMAEETPQNQVIRLECVCGEELRMEPELLGRSFPCPHCGRYLRPGLQFLMVEQKLAPNLAVMGGGGRVIIGKAKGAGKTVKCKMCGQRVVLPKAIQPKKDRAVIHMPAHVLEKKLNRARKRLKNEQKSGERGDVERLRRAGHRGRISLRPGQSVCVNQNCSTPMPPGANICPRCGTNLKTKIRCDAPGPEADPKGKWQQP